MGEPVHTKAWVLRRNPWQESGLLVELFSAHMGLVKVIFPGGKRTSSKNILPQLYEFIELKLSGKSDLKNGVLLESINKLWVPQQAQVLSLNFAYKLLIAFMRPLEPDLNQYHLYSNFIGKLQGLDFKQADYRLDLQKITLQFGLDTLDLAGYFPSATVDVANQPLQQEQMYYFGVHNTLGLGWQMANTKYSGYSGEVIMQVIGNKELVTLAHRQCSYSMIANVMGQFK